MPWLGESVEVRGVLPVLLKDTWVPKLLPRQVKAGVDHLKNIFWGLGLIGLSGEFIRESQRTSMLLADMVVEQGRHI